MATLILYPTPVCSNPVNFRLKSKALSRALGSNEESETIDAKYDSGKPENSESSISKAHQKNQKINGGNISLDLTGMFDILVAAPSVDLEEGSTEQKRPLIEMNSQLLPSLHVGVHYNFNTIWYGATRVFARIQYKPRSWIESEQTLEPTNQPTINTFGERIKTKIRNLVDSLDTQYTADRSILDATDYSTKFLMRFPSLGRKTSSPWISVKRNTMPVATSSIGIGLGLLRYLDIIIRATGVDGSSPSNVCLNAFTVKLPKPGGDAWIPNFKINPLGQLVSSSELGLASRRGFDLGARLVVRKQLNWSPTTNFFDMDGLQNTRIRLDLYCMNQQQDNISTASVETLIENLRETKATLTSEFLVKL